jgi:hypothetical protein
VETVRAYAANWGRIPKTATAGTALDFSLAENFILGVHYRATAYAGNVLLDQHAIDQRADIIERFDVRPPNAALPARALQRQPTEINYWPRVFCWSKTPASVATHARSGYRRY